MASTTDARFLIDVSKRIEVGPHLRVHEQTGVDFWQIAYTVRPGFDILAYRTGDRELGPLRRSHGTGGTLRRSASASSERADEVGSWDSTSTRATRATSTDLYVTDR